VSDKNNDSTESSEQGAVTPAEVTPAEVDKPVKSPKASPKKEKSSGKGSSGVAWLALLLVLGIAGAGVWLGKQALGREAQLSARIVALESAPAASEDTSVADLSQLWQTQLAAESAKREELSRTQTEQLQGIESRLAQQRAELSRFGAVDRQDWLLAEAQYLLRLANQRLIMADDVVAAKALLGSADSILKELDDVTLYAVRAAVAADLAAVRAVPQRDVQGMYLALAALIEQADKLVIFQMPEKIERARVEPAEDWKGRLLQGYEAALLKLSDYLIIRRRDVPIEALMDPQWEGLVRQNLRMLLEQAQVALLSGNELLFRESLERAQHWLTEFFVSDEAAAKALADEVAVLREAKIALEMPDISRSLAAVDEALKQRMQNGGGE
jgi:uroporphyrin-3 C-methyltransferase